MLNGPRRTVERARDLRRRMSYPEILLWTHLRKHPGGRKLRRQHAAGPYVLDFFCPDADPVMEVDGLAHDTGNQPAHDATRDAWLIDNGLQVVRIPATRILENAAAVTDQIVSLCDSRHLPLHQPAAGPPPRSGEER